MDSKKGGYIQRSGKAPDEKELALINKYTRREFKADELYTFPVVLCDNEIDRDGERFSLNALEKLSALFVGKTGILNHDVKAQNQTARIYSCRVEKDGTTLASFGKPYARLIGMAYMPKTDKNADFITELESGIKKEVSVGCAVSKVTCSICGADLKNGCCEHKKGMTYGNKICCAVLDEPTDAYEWSFVAVPAQKEAGVIKHYNAKEAINTENVFKSIKDANGSITLTKSQCAEILEKTALLEKEAACGRAYREAVTKDFIKYTVIAEPQIPADTVKRAAGSMDIDDLKCWAAAFKKQAEKIAPLTPQLTPGRHIKENDTDFQFKI